MIVFGLFIDRLIASSNTNLVYLAFVIPAVLILLNRSLLKSDSSHLRMASRWTLKSYGESIAGLDERERQVIDQAYRMSYRTIALVCWLAICLVSLTWCPTCQQPSLSGKKRSNQRFPLLEQLSTRVLMGHS